MNIQMRYGPPQPKELSPFIKSLISFTFWTVLIVGFCWGFLWLSERQYLSLQAEYHKLCNERNMRYVTIEHARREQDRHRCLDNNNVFHPIVRF